jgi:hypothetical protein
MGEVGDLSGSGRRTTVTGYPAPQAGVFVTSKGVRWSHLFLEEVSVRVFWRFELNGHRFGRLIVLKFKEVKNKKNHWLCLCECGNEVSVPTDRLKNGMTTSCGCYQKERAREVKTSHGYSYSSEYKSWASMKARCLNPKNIGWELYGGRGIKVCERWLNSFENFLEDMGPKPTKEHTLDRKDADGDYEPNNCRWATEKEQQNNRRNNHVVEYKGETLTLTQLCEKLGKDLKLVHLRLTRYEWSLEDALNVPVSKLYEYEGEALSMTQWARRKGINRRTLNARISRGMSISEAIELGIRERSK